MKEMSTGWLAFAVAVAVAVIAWVTSITMIEGKEGDEGKRWAVLVAGSNGYYNYRHQADICHAYQILRKGGLPDENIIVFMDDDIAFDSANPTPGVLINKPNGPDVYKGVPKDYTGTHANKHNLFAVILGNRSALTGGSGKVVDSGPLDSIFFYYADHGGPGFLGMPNDVEVFADELIGVLKKKHAAEAYKYMVIYVEACESGSMFQGILPSDIDIYATTAANAYESSYATYCPKFHPSAPPQYDTCLGDVYSVSWMEDWDKHDMTMESLGRQYQIIRRRTLFGYVDVTSHVMQFGNKNLSNYPVATFIGTDPHNTNRTLNDNIADDAYYSSAFTTPPTLVGQRDVQLLYLRHKVEKAPDALKKQEAQKELVNELSERKHVDKNIRFIGDLLFGHHKSSVMLAYVRPHDQSLVHDWDCLRTLMKTYERHCGRLSTYGKKYSRAFANMCNEGITVHQLAAASSQVCPHKHPPSYTSSST